MAFFRRVGIASAIGLSALFLTESRAKDISFPAGAVIDAKAYGAKGDGKTSDRASLQKAIHAAISPYFGGYLYLPEGTYLLDGPLEWKTAAGNWSKGLSLVGHGRDKVILKLMDRCPGFRDPQRTSAVLVTADGMGGTAAGNGAENLGNGFLNFIENLTVDVGEGNPGAVGIDFIGNNSGGVRDVAIVSRSGAGYAGLSLSRPTVGPAFFKNITVRGFDYGIYAQESSLPQTVSLTFENLRLEDQNKAAFFNHKQISTLHGLVTRNAPVALLNSDPAGLVSLIDADLGGSRKYGQAAIVSRGHLRLRNIAVSGFERAVENRGSPIPGRYHAEFTSSRPSNPGGARSPDLPVRETPDYFDADTSHWMALPPPGGGDDGPALNRALDNAAALGKTTVWFRKGGYRTGVPLRLYGGLRHLLGTGTQVEPIGPLKTLLIIDVTAPDLRISHIILGNWQLDNPDLVFIHHRSKAALTLSGITLWDQSAQAYRQDAAGDLFIEDVGCHAGAGGWFFGKGQRVWARQFNVEGARRTNIVNDGADIWVLGLKHEKDRTLVLTKGGGRTEIYGGVSRCYRGLPVPSLPIFVNDGSTLSLSHADIPASPGYRFKKQILDFHEGLSRTVRDVDVIDRSDYYSGRDYGTFIPSFNSAPASRHPVRVPSVPPLDMDETEVTQRDFGALMGGYNPSRRKDPDLPVESATWFDAILYCNLRSGRAGLKPAYSFSSRKFEGKRCVGLADLEADWHATGYRLPTAREWRLAYGAGSATDFFWGEDSLGARAGEYAWSAENSGYGYHAVTGLAVADSAQSHPVGEKHPNAWGAYDMAGNVREWVWSDSLPGSPEAEALGGSYTATGGKSRFRDLSKDAAPRFAKAGAWPEMGFRAVRARRDR
ncbi:MAG: hypothetical protein JWP91_1686 [Fibrobacteres bacterium]|nr:hypothetical protein [Fibrobacterota bacterium]